MVEDFGACVCRRRDSCPRRKARLLRFGQNELVVMEITGEGAPGLSGAGRAPMIAEKDSAWEVGYA